MKKFLFHHLLILTVFLSILRLGKVDAQKPLPSDNRKTLELVFAIDTTGSMGGLIEGAKQKIWAISNQIASGKPVPSLKVGLVAYRDRTDAYVTKVFDLTDDLDAVGDLLAGEPALAGQVVRYQLGQLLGGDHPVVPSEGSTSENQ
mgnify:CR=1 FL=1